MAKQLCAVTLMLLSMVSPATAGEDSERVQATSKAWEKAFNAGDAKALAALYAPDAKLLPPNLEFIQGRDSIEAYWAQFITGVKGELQIQETQVQADFAFLLGTFTIFDRDRKEVDRGKYVEIWKRGTGGWELYRDIWNTSLPHPAPAAQ